MKHIKYVCLLLVLVLMCTMAVAAAAEPLKVTVIDVFSRVYRVAGGSGSYEVVSAMLTNNKTGEIIPESVIITSGTDDWDERYVMYTFSVTVHDLVTGETVSASMQSFRRLYTVWGCDRGSHYMYGSEDAGEPSENALPVGEKEYTIIDDEWHMCEYLVSMRCIYCDAYMETKEYQYKERHKYDAVTGVCACGHRVAPACEHSTESTVIDIDYTPSETDPTKHICRKFMADVCTLCGETIRENGYVDEQELHDFDNWGNCLSCGFKADPKCQHYNKTPVAGTKTYDPEAACTETQHVVDIMYDLVCVDCGMVDGFQWDEEWEDHQFSEYGTCLMCGYVRNPVDAPLSLSLFVWKNRVCVGEYIAVSAAVSGGSGDWSQSIYAWSDTGLSIYDQSGFTAMSTGTWTFEMTVTDNVTGETVKAVSPPILVGEHDWQAKIEPKTWAPSERDKTLHYAATTHKYDICAYCGAKADEIVIRSHEEGDALFFECHTYDDLTCSVCGYLDIHYSLYCPDAKYVYGDWVLIPQDSGIRIMVRDNRTGKICSRHDLENMILDCKLESGMTISDVDYLHIDTGTAEITLRYKGKDIDKLYIGATWLDVTTWGWNEGEAAGTTSLRMEDLQNVPWNKTGLWLNISPTYDIAMFDFEATREGAYYIITFDLYNSSPVSYGVASYYPDGTECDRQMIEGFSPEWGLFTGGWETAQLAFDMFSARYGDDGFMTQKTEVSLKVPVGGMFRFLEAKDDKEVAIQNVIEAWMGMLAGCADYLDLLYPGDAVSQSKVKKALKDPETWAEFRDLVVGEIIEALGKSFKPKDVLSLTTTGTDFAIKLLENEDIGKVLFNAIEKLAMKATWGAAESAAEKIIMLKYSSEFGLFILNGEDWLMDKVATGTHLNAMFEYASDDLDAIQYDCIFVPAN